MGVNLTHLGNINQAVPVTAEKELAAAFQTRQWTVYRDLLAIRQVEKWLVRVAGIRGKAEGVGQSNPGIASPNFQQDGRLVELFYLLDFLVDEHNILPEAFSDIGRAFGNKVQGGCLVAISVR